MAEATYVLVVNLGKDATAQGLYFSRFSPQDWGRATVYDFFHVNLHPGDASRAWADQLV